MTWFNSGKDRPVLHKWLKKMCKHYIYQLERGEKSGKLHFQVYFNLKEKTRDGPLVKSSTAAGINGATFKPASDKGKTALKEYCMKEETREEGPWADTPIYLGEDLIKVLRPWQKKIADLLDAQPHRRKIYWYYDADGGMGKSSFSKWMYFNHQVLTLTIGKASDLLNLVYKMQGHRMYILDVSRTVPAGSMTELYMAIESVKNGYFVNTKYETGVACFAIPHVVVFSNHLPKKSALSADRWDIIDMSQMSQGN